MVWLSIWHMVKAQLMVPVIIICYGSKEEVSSRELPLDYLCEVSNCAGYYQKMLLQHKKSHSRGWIRPAVTGRPTAGLGLAGSRFLPQKETASVCPPRVHRPVGGLNVLPLPFGKDILPPCPVPLPPKLSGLDLGFFSGYSTLDTQLTGHGMGSLWVLSLASACLEGFSDSWRTPSVISHYTSYSPSQFADHFPQLSFYHLLQTHMIYLRQYFPKNIPWTLYIQFLP